MFLNNKVLFLYILCSMKDKLDRLEDIRIENYIWIVYLVIIGISYYANYKEKRYILYDDDVSKREYQNLLILIFSILVVVYFYFVWDSYKDVVDLDYMDSFKKVALTYASFVGSLLVFVSGVIFLVIAILDEEIDIELAFN